MMLGPTQPTARAAPQRAPRTTRTTVLAAMLVLLPPLAAGVRVYRGGIDALTYDECEYVRFALLTHDAIRARGVAAWPRLVARTQHYAKPPLLVNTLAASVLALGRGRIVAAMALHAATVL